MACTGFKHSLQTFVQEARRSRDTPAFLVPAFICKKRFSTTPQRCSRIGREPISVPPEVTLRLFELSKTTAKSRNVDTPTHAVEFTGPRGQMTLALPPYIYAKHDEADRKVTVTVGNPDIKHQKAMWGTMRAYMQNYMAGVSEGHISILRMVGVGYRATIETSAITKQPKYPGQKFVSLKLGYAHPIELGVPEGVTASVPQPTRILLEGTDKHAITQFAADIRKWRVPEPYKGKGIFVDDETIRLKGKKIK